MRRIPLLIAALTGLTACVATTFPETTQELRDMPRGALAVKAETYTVPRPPNAVMATFRSRAKPCLYFNTRNYVPVHRGMPAMIETTFRPDFERSGRTQTLLVESLNVANVGNPGWYPRYAVDVTPVGSGSQITVYGPAMGSAWLRDTVRAWAEGDPRPCPGYDL
jgi:hypothetical protein